MKRALVLGAGGFIGSHMVTRLRQENYWVRGVDLKVPEFSSSDADQFLIGDLTNSIFASEVMALDDAASFDEIYQFAADMGGAGFIFTGDNDAEIMHNSASINLNVLHALKNRNTILKENRTKIFYSSSACIYPEYNQADPADPNCSEDSAYPALPDSEYGWEKLFSERLFLAYHRNYDIHVRIARFHNVYGPEGAWTGGREKAPAAICRKVALAENGTPIEIWGDGEQTRSFLYIDECINAVRKFVTHPDFIGPVNIGSEEMVTINQLVEIAARVAKKEITIRHIVGPLGVRGRNSNNTLARKEFNWDNETSLESGIARTYTWIVDKINLEKTAH